MWTLRCLKVPFLFCTNLLMRYFAQCSIYQYASVGDKKGGFIPVQSCLDVADSFPARTLITPQKVNLASPEATSIWWWMRGRVRCCSCCGDACHAQVVRPVTAAGERRPRHAFALLQFDKLHSKLISSLWKKEKLTEGHTFYRIENTVYIPDSLSL